MNGIWEVNLKSINYYVNDKLIFSDSEDHWRNAILRLLNISDADAKSWIEFISQYESDLNVIGLIERTNIFFDVKKNAFNPNTIDNIIDCIDGESDLFIKSSGFFMYSELHSKKLRNKVTPPKYEEVYFEGNEVNFGYGDLSTQITWRMEKASRYYEKLSIHCFNDGFNINNLKKVLDIGSGYGFMRQPFLENKIDNDGIEISEYAIRAAKKLFNIETFNVDITQLNSMYDCILAYDLIEHLDDPKDYIRSIKNNLLADGYLVIRTPNLLSLEFYMFVNKYHSLKKEHLNYFTVQSLIFLLQDLGFSIINIETETHLMSGLFYINEDNINNTYLGSDIYCIAKLIK